MLRLVIEFIFFVGSTGVLFNEQYRKNVFAVVTAGMIALASTGSFFMSFADFSKNSQSTMPPEEVFWYSIRDSQVPGLFEEFEKRFPSSKYVAEARAKLQQLNRNQSPIVPPVAAPRGASTSTPPQKLCVTFNNRQICE